jgi:hypothetical protein
MEKDLMMLIHILTKITFLYSCKFENMKIFSNECEMFAISVIPLHHTYYEIPISAI